MVGFVGPHSTLRIQETDWSDRMGCNGVFADRFLMERKCVFRNEQPQGFVCPTELDSVRRKPSAPFNSDQVGRKVAPFSW